ncbi:MAG: tRNA lysidine(34) synthetase TilS [Betaproteobacteria bacterium]
MASSKTLEETVGAVLLRQDVQSRRICVGLSGGLDSISLLHVLAALRDKSAFALSALHVHHGLSPNADAWAAFCQSFCASRNIPLLVTRVTLDRNAPGGIEALARAQRYAAFNEVDADFIALAQHADDQAETVLHQLLRGTGLKGMAGMGETRQLRDGLTLLRPFLSVARSDIEAYAQEHGLKWIEDESNTDTQYTRNFLRLEVMPQLAARFPHYRESFARAGRHASEADEMLAALAAIDLKWDGKTAFADLLDTLPSMRQVNALYHWLQWMRPAGLGESVIPSRAQLATWAGQLFRETPTDKPHQAGGHDFVIRRRKNVLFLDWK